MSNRSFKGLLIFALLLLLIPSTARSQNSLAIQDETQAAQSDAQQAAAGAVRLHVLTWNVKGGSCNDKRSDEDFTPVVQALQHRNNIYHLDVVALQEVFFDQAKRIRKALGLSSKHMHFYPTIRCGVEPDRGNAIISRYAFEENSEVQRYFETQHPDEYHVVVQGGERRNIIGGSIKVDGRRVYLFTTHLTARPDPNWRGQTLSGNCRSHEDSCEANSYRANQARESVQFIEEMRPSDHKKPFRAILMGDFNAERNPEIPLPYNAYAQVTEKFRDAWAIWAHNEGIAIDSKKGYTNPSNKPAPTHEPPKKRIDYIFLRKSSGINVVRVTVPKDSRYASDHYSVLAFLAFN